MIIAKLGSPLQIGPAAQLFPNVSFPETGPTEEWLQANSAALVEEPLFDPDSQVKEKLRYPVIRDGKVYLNQVREMTAEEYQARQQEKLTWVTQEAATLLQQTDWTEVPSVSDATQPIYLSNAAEFAAYRAELRVIAVNPTLNPAWPTRPATQWTTN